MVRSRTLITGTGQDQQPAVEGLAASTPAPPPTITTVTIAPEPQQYHHLMPGTISENQKEKSETKQKQQNQQKKTNKQTNRKKYTSI